MAFVTNVKGKTMQLKPTDDIGLHLGRKEDVPISESEFDEMRQKINEVIGHYGFRVQGWAEWERFRSSMVDETIFIDALHQRIAALDFKNELELIRRGVELAEKREKIPTYVMELRSILAFIDALIERCRLIQESNSNQIKKENPT